MTKSRLLRKIKDRYDKNQKKKLNKGMGKSRLFRKN